MARLHLVAALFVLTACQSNPKEPLRVAAAADLAPAFAELGPAFTGHTPADLKLTFGSTGLLARQIEQGAPFDLFLAANLGYAQQVIQSGACDGASLQSYGRGRLVLWTKGSGGAALSLAALAEPRFKHIAIANPEHAPYGKAARDALTRAGVWAQVSSRLVYGENVQQAFQLASTGNADVAIIGLSLVTNARDGSWAFVDEALHAPLEQALVVCQNGANPSAARKLAEFLQATEGRAILRRYGFLLPGEAWAAAR